ncbi:MAG: hypothetical protein J4F28_08190 [Nitrosopumilaceae archaeon]|nr:hypothetical protein [Nitrosopumilaceae archaeon]
MKLTILRLLETGEMAVIGLFQYMRDAISNGMSGTSLRAADAVTVMHHPSGHIIRGQSAS